MSDYHESVLLDEAVSSLELKPSDIVVDATLGGGGHSGEILKRIPEGRLIGFDRDPDALEECEKRLAFASNKLLVNANFDEMKQILETLGAVPDKILFDLGVSGHQLDACRGFSFQRDEYLDMRMSGASSGDRPCAWYVNNLSEEELAGVIFRYGEERLSRVIAGAICRSRKEAPIESTLQLAGIIEKAAAFAYKGKKIHPATKTFQALRIAVNHELEHIEKALEDSIGILAPGGIISVISFHSLEDRIVKRIFRHYSGKCICPPDVPFCVCGPEKVLCVKYKKPVVPSQKEITANPRSRSAKLRSAVKI
ncbi:MAG: 16S rRNA (cytosine(1402)-N(4))-methyltransferase RsmH [Abditibacteriota bacterium]|nr:16S rRNA (cytosine(1402)-N(4))-methyltransferase RsmH [Abditibacteriota bacterium]